MAITKLKKQDLPFKEVLKKLMKNHDLSVSQVARLAGVGRTVFHDWLVGRSPQDLVAIGRLARSLNVSMRELLLNECEDKNIESYVEENASSAEQLVLEGLFRMTLHRVFDRKLKKERVPKLTGKSK